MHTELGNLKLDYIIVIELIEDSCGDSLQQHQMKMFLQSNISRNKKGNNSIKNKS